MLNVNKWMLKFKRSKSFHTNNINNNDAAVGGLDEEGAAATSRISPHNSVLHNRIEDDGEDTRIVFPEQHAVDGNESEDELDVIEAIHQQQTNAARELTTFQKKLISLKTRLPYYVPVLKWLPNYQIKKDLISDIIAGITIAVMIIPQSLAYANLANVPLQMGLYTSWSPLILYSIFGTSRQLCMGPVSVVSILTGSLILSLDPLPTPDQAAILASMLAFFCGLFTFVLGLLRFGFLDNTLSRPLLRGFVCALAVVVVSEQLSKLSGVNIPHEAPTYTKFYIFLRGLRSEVHWLSLFISISSASFLLGFKYIKGSFPTVKAFKFIPPYLILVGMWIVLGKVLRLDLQGVDIVGKIDARFPVPSLPLANVSLYKYIPQIITSACVCSIIGFIESIIAAKTFARKHSYNVSSNRELVAIGVSNLVGSCFGIFPAYASLARSSVGEGAGMRTQLASLIASSIVLMAIFFLTPAFYFLPKPVMGAIIAVAAIGLIEFHDIAFLIKVRDYRELGLLCFTFVFTVLFGLQNGIFACIGVSVLLVIKHTTLPHIAIMGKMPGPHAQYRDISLFPEAQTIEGVVVIRIEEALYFANIGQVKDIFDKIERPLFSLKQAPPLKALVIDAKNLPSMDTAALQVLIEMIEDYHRRGVAVCFVQLRDSIRSQFTKAGIFDILGNTCLFGKTNEAMSYLESRGIINNSSSSSSDSNKSQVVRKDEKQYQQYNNYQSINVSDS